MTIDNIEINQVYLAGCKGDWREKFKKVFPEWIHIDPFEHSDQSCIAHFVDGDLAHVQNSDLVIMYIGYHRYTGSCVEAGYAKALNIPIILIWGLEGRLDSMLLGVSSYVFNTVKSTIEFVRKRLYK